MTGVRVIWNSVLVILCLNINYGYGFIKKYSEQYMCNNTIRLGNNGLYAVELDFDFLFRKYVRCWTKFDIPESYTVAYKFLNAQSIHIQCDTTLNISHSTGYQSYPFCQVSTFPLHDVILKSHRNLTFHFQSTRDAGFYDMQIYIFKTNQVCGNNNVRCKNGRCINHGLFCDTKNNFCGDSTVTGACGNDVEEPSNRDYAFDKINIVGPICLGLFGILVLICAAYFCCRSTRIRSMCGQPVDSRQRRARQLTARDVYIINVSDAGGTPDEGYDYVVDYKKFSAPPEYSSLENIADASERYAGLNNDTTDGTTDGADDGVTTEGGNVNAGFVGSDGDELPAYDHVMRNTEEYNVNHNHL